MVELAKETIAQEQIEAFLDNMRRLGFGKAETLARISRMLEELKK